jgi:phosphoribosylformylglycinamidine synthase
MVLKHKGQIVADIPLAPLFDDAPVYDRPWTPTPARPRLTGAEVDAPADYAAAVLKLMSAPGHGLQALALGAVRPPRHGRHPGGQRHRRRRRASCACTGPQGAGHDLRRHPALRPGRPYEGGKQAVGRGLAQPDRRRRLPIAITDNLNFGNPSGPEIMGQIVRAIDGMAEACRELGLPRRERQRQPLQRDQRRRDPAHARVGGVGLIAD